MRLVSRVTPMPTEDHSTLIDARAANVHSDVAPGSVGDPAVGIGLRVTRRSPVHAGQRMLIKLAVADLWVNQVLNSTAIGDGGDNRAGMLAMELHSRRLLRAC